MVVCLCVNAFPSFSLSKFVSKFVHKCFSGLLYRVRLYLIYFGMIFTSRFFFFFFFIRKVSSRCISFVLGSNVQIRVFYNFAFVFVQRS